MTVEQLSDGASSFRIVLDDSDEAISDGKISILEGMECTVEMGFAESGTKQVIKGYVTGVKPKRSEFSRKMFTVTGFDGLSKLTRGRKRRSWENIKDSDIAAQIAQECSLQPDVQDSGLVHPYVVQNNENNLNFLFERARRIGYEVKVEGEKLVFRKPREVKADVTLRWDGTNVREKGGLLLQRMDFNTSTMNMPKKVVVRSYDPKSASRLLHLHRPKITTKWVAKKRQAMPPNLEIPIRRSKSAINPSRAKKKPKDLPNRFCRNAQPNSLRGRASALAMAKSNAEPKSTSKMSDRTCRANTTLPRLNTSFALGMVKVMVTGRNFLSPEQGANCVRFVRVQVARTTFR